MSKLESMVKLRRFLCKSPSTIEPWEVGEYLEAIEQELDERYIALPVDAEGVPVHVGDAMRATSGGVYKVARITREDRSGTVTWYVEDWRSDYSLNPCDLRHYKPPTVEDVLREFFTLAVRGKKAHASDIDDAVLAEYAKKLRLAKEE